MEFKDDVSIQAVCAIFMATTRYNSKLNSWGGLIFAAALLLVMYCLQPLPCYAQQAEVETFSGLLEAARFKQSTSVPLNVAGTVLWSSPADGKIILKDEATVQLFDLQVPNSFPAFGQRVHLEGTCAILKTRDAIVLSPEPVVENNGLHPLIEKSGSVHLDVGKHPIELSWFNRTHRFGLEVEYKGPGFERRAIPNIKLFRPDHTKVDDGYLANGLAYRMVQGQWWRVLPNFDHLDEVRAGYVENFDIGVRTQDNHVGLQFKGYIDIQRKGDYTFYVRSDDGSRLFVGPSSLSISRLEEVGLPLVSPLALYNASPSVPEFLWTEIEGEILAIHRSGNTLELELTVGPGAVRVRVAENSEVARSLKPHQRIRVKGTGRRIRNVSGNWVWGSFFIQRLEQDHLVLDHNDLERQGDLPLLTSIREIYQLGVEESSRKYPVKVRGIVTSPMENNGAVIQDSNRGIYVELNGPINLQAGDYCEIEGSTGPYTFSHYIEASRVTVLGAGIFPEPVAPSWDQLINGSLHCNYVQLEGVVASVAGDTVALLTRGGRINVRLNPDGASLPGALLGATIRLQGCLLADWDGATRRVMVGSIYMDQHLVSIVEPAPEDPFLVGYKQVGDLLQFDPQAGALQRVRVWGLLIHKNEDGISCLTDGGNGLRFMLNHRIDAEVGDMVDVSGFLELGESFPVLREAVLRRTDRVELPEPYQLEPENLLREDLDATWVTVDGVLLGINEQLGRTVLELQNGLQRFGAELSQEFNVGDLLPGSRLELTGAYLGVGGNRVLNRPIDSFRLLLNSSHDIVVVSEPPWWTLRRMLSVVGLLAAVLIAAAIWIKLLRSTVEERTAELGSEIHVRQLAEHEREIEKERSRVAHDLHDDLGAHLTEVNMLASLVDNPLNSSADRKKYTEQMRGIALHMVTALDEIVWAVNPRNDTVSSLAGYFGAHAQRLLELAEINCGLDTEDNLPAISLDHRSRREIFLAFKEAVTNIIQHAEASKVWLRVKVEDTYLIVEVVDDGIGFVPAEQKIGADGLMNMQERLCALGGDCAIDSEPGKGTSIRFRAPV